MTQQFKQIIYCNDSSSLNNPSSLRAIDLVNGSAFTGITPLCQLGIQAPPGTKFFINGSTNPAIVGFTGLFEIDLTDGGDISSITFDTESISYIESNDSAILIIDMAYWTGGNG